eukprot:9306317-Prorocentrum_lima.AAC.1
MDGSMVVHGVAMRCAHWKWHCMCGVDGAAAAATVRLGWVGIGRWVSRGQEGKNCGLRRTIAAMNIWIGDT